MSPAWETAFRTLAGVGYVAASAAYGARLLLRHPPGEAVPWPRGAALAGALCQTAAIGLQCVLTHRTPIASPADSLSISAWAVALLYLILDFGLRPAPPALGAVALLSACGLLFGGAVLGHPSPALPHGGLLDSRLVSVHVLTILFAFALLVMAFGCAALYSVQHRLLKQKRVAGGLFGRLPPLARLDGLAFTLVAFGFPLLTVGLLTGAIEASAGPSMPWGHDPKVLASLVTWLIYGLYLILHQFAHWRGPRANALLIGGLAAAVVTYLVPTVHRFG